MIVEQNLERNVVDDYDKGDLVRYASIQEMFQCSLSIRCFSCFLWLAPFLEEQIDIRSTKLYLLTM